MNQTIMIVDDLKLNIDILAENLSDEYSIMPAISGEAAMKMLVRKKPDLVLLDIFMPGVGGFDVLEFMKGRKDLADIPVIFVSGESDPDLEEKSLLMGVAEYVKKPFNPSVIKAKIKNQLELNAYRNNLKLLVEERTKHFKASLETIVTGMAIMSECLSSSPAHIGRIRGLTDLLANKALEEDPRFIPPDTARHLVLYSPIHDIGKIFIPDVIVNKPESLTEEEYGAMKAHAVEGAEMLRKIEAFHKESGISLRTVIEMAEYHHEKYDGSGYPSGLKGEQIPASARITALVDVYDALRSSRLYRKAFTHDEAVEIIFSSDTGTNAAHFDPVVLKAFRDNITDIRRIYED